MDLSGLQQQVGLVGELMTSTFDSWHKDKQQAAKGVCWEFFNHKQSLVLWSKRYGSGKTYCAAAVMNEWLRRDIHRRDPATGLPIYYHEDGRVLPNGPAWRISGAFVKMQDLFGQAKSLLDGRGSDLWDLLGVLQRTPLLVLDDLCRATPSDFENDLIYRIVDYRENMGLPYIATTNASPAELGEWLWGATASRLKRARFVHLEEIDYRGI